ncbi:cytochrome c [Massilia sp. Mn16-1_5]|uniref:c-type cytochrome n=1 Tax=Massilia sp. Mn16-1_5 TaxID=2079199 RepID=UPI00109E9DB8|nr:cytochrome c [Massilia sp. Mn16-1_5]THC40763.1 alcohol dehydrogenase [Massilia sp. Mn16-1_5]
MKRIPYAVLLLLVVAAALVALAWPREEFIASTSPADHALVEANIARGAYLARAGDCMACHTARGGVPYAGGRALDTPFGRLVAPNITPEPTTGIGNWTPDDFWRALHNGKSKDGRLLYPAFPYVNYTRVTRRDADALFAYLRTLPPVRQPNLPHELRFPYNQQLTLAGWRLLYFRPGVQQPDASRDARWNRGAYLVEGLGHCAACHSTRNSLGATEGTLGGGLIPTLGWYAPSLTSDAEAGLGNWSEAHIVQLLGTGVAPGASVTGPMAEVVVQSLQHMTKDDLGAMAAYLKSLPAASNGERPAAPRPSEQTMRAGERLYGQHCATCHGERGEGKGPYPTLARNRALALSEPVNAIRVVLNGGFAPGTQGNPRPYGMPPFGHVLGDTEVAALVSFLRASWGNAAAPVSSAEVNRYRSVPLD